MGSPAALHLLAAPASLGWALGLPSFQASCLRLREVEKHAQATQLANSKTLELSPGWSVCLSCLPSPDRRHDASQGSTWALVGSKTPCIFGREAVSLLTVQKSVSQVLACGPPLQHHKSPFYEQRLQGPGYEPSAGCRNWLEFSWLFSLSKM